MLFYLTEPAALLGIALAFIIGVYARDAAQVGAARLVRDPTPARSGRLRAGLGRRVSPFSWVAVLIAGVGWAEPVPMNDVWRKRRFHVSAALLAGPLAYLLLTVAALGGFRALADRAVITGGNRGVEIGAVSGFALSLLLWMAITFGMMFILSLVPVPPTDGGRILFLLGPQSPGWRNVNYRLTESNLGVVILLAILLLPRLLPSLVPSITGQLIGPLLVGLGGLVGLDLG